MRNFLFHASFHPVKIFDQPLGSNRSLGQHVVNGSRNNVSAKVGDDVNDDREVFRRILPALFIFAFW